MKLVKFGKLIGGFYQSNQKLNTLIVVAIGAPNLIDIDSFRNVEILLNAGYDVIVPEYYGFCRSEGIFTPMNSIKTLLDTKNIFQKGTIINVYSGEKIEVNYNNFIFLGISYGGGVVSLLPKYDTEIKNIAMIYPVTDYSTFGKMGVKEETVDDFLKVVNTGFINIYRGLNLPIWKKHFNDEADLTPIKNIKYLDGVKMFLSHGKKDTSIYYKKTSNYFNKIKQIYPNNIISYKEYEGLGHDGDTLKRSLLDIIDLFK